MAGSYIESISKHELGKRKEAVCDGFLKLRNSFIKVLEALEADHSSANYPKAKFQTTDLTEDAHGETGKLDILKGEVFEKAVIYTPTINQPISINKDMELSYWNSSIQIMLYPHNPFVPALSVQFYMIVTDYIWFNFAIELIPMLLPQREEDAKDVLGLQKSLQFVFTKYANIKLYENALQAGKSHFLIPHRSVTRGCKGLFGEQLSSNAADCDWNSDFNLILKLGKALTIAYPYFVDSNVIKEWSDDHRMEQLVFRGLCAEYNLVCDTNIAFGLNKKKPANVALAVLPPICYWP